MAEGIEAAANEAGDAEADDADDIEEEDAVAAAAVDDEASSREVSADRHSSKHAPMIGNICRRIHQNSNKRRIKIKIT